MIWRRVAVIAAVAAIAAAAGGYSFKDTLLGPAGADPTNAKQGDRLQGQADWQNRKLNGKLPAPPHDAMGHPWHHADKQLFEMTKLGIEAFAPPGYRTDMPGFAGRLGDDDIWAVLAYIKSTWPPDIRAGQARLNARSDK